MSPLPFSPYLLGLLRIFLARSWRARIIAALFGIVSIGLGLYYIWCIHHSPSELAGVQMTAPPVIAALSVSIVSLLVTFYVDKKTKA